MFRCYVTAAEVYDQFPYLKEWIKQTPLQTVINASALVVADDLRQRDMDLSRLCIPLSLSTSGTAIGNERRIVVDASSIDGAGISFQFQGSNDNITYTNIQNLDGSNAVLDINNIGRHSIRLGELHTWIQYSVTGTGTYSVFMVDTAFDNLIIYATLKNACLPVLTNENARLLYEQSAQLYQSALMNKFDYDVDASGSIESTEKSVTRHLRLKR